MHYVVRFSPLFISILLTACFRTGAPTPTFDPSAEGDVQTFAIIGDYGTNTTSEADVAALVNSWKVDFVATVGDNNYSYGEASTIDQNIGKYYSRYIKPYRGNYGSGSADINRFWPALGNHDWYSISCSGSACSGPYFDYFDLPNNERYYDVQIGAVHLFMLDSYTREPDGITGSSVQASWLRNELAASSAPHKLVLLHHAPYSSSSKHGSDPTLQWPFEAWGATAVVAGHDHHYERMKIGNIPYFVNGAGGRPLYALGALLPETQVAYDDDFGAMRVRVENTQIHYEFFNRAGALIDSYSQTNGSSGSEVSRQIASGNDDAEENSSGAVYLASTDLELVSDSNLGYVGQTVGLRFQDLAIPRGSSILEATLEFTVDEPSFPSTNLRFVGEAADNAASYSSAAFNISGRPKTAAQVSWRDVPEWPNVGAKHKTPNLASIVQEIVNRNGWQSGNALALMVTGNGRRTAESLNGSSVSAPRLTVRYESAPTNRPPNLWRPSDQTHLVGETVRLQLSASDPDGDALSFSASGLPNGVSINSGSGLVGGAPSAAGNYSVSVSVSDGRASARASFSWRVDEAGQTRIFSAQVSAREDDAEEYLGDGSVRLNSTDLELAVEKQAQAIGIRFRDVSVPPGAVITQAYLTFGVDEATSGSSNLTVRGEASDSAAAYTGAVNAVTRRPLTAASRSWTNLPPWSLGQFHDSPDLAPLVQEIVNRPGWQAGNALAFVVTGSGRRTAESFDGSRSRAPRLTVKYRMDRQAGSVDVRIATGNDDAEERSDGSIYRNSTDLELIYDKGVQTVGLRFNGVAIPRGARITRAYVQFKVDESSSGATQLTLRAQAADNAEPFEYVDGSISSRPQSGAAVGWTPSPWTTLGEAGTAQRTPDLTALIQEVVARPGWQPGNALALIVTGTGERVAESYNGDAGGAPLLHVDFE